MPFSKELRNTLTEPEVILWNYLRKKQILGIQFYRQKVLGNYIVDFYAPAVDLIIEVDGSQHYEPEAIAYDLARDAFMNEVGLTVLRFNNDDVRQHTTLVLEKIYNYIKETSSSRSDH